jgi:hypothetical protein
MTVGYRKNHCTEITRGSNDTRPTSPRQRLVFDAAMTVGYRKNHCTEITRGSNDTRPTSSRQRLVFDSAMTVGYRKNHCTEIAHEFDNTRPTSSRQRLVFDAAMTVGYRKNHCTEITHEFDNTRPTSPRQCRSAVLLRSTLQKGGLRTLSAQTGPKCGLKWRDGIIPYSSVRFCLHLKKQFTNYAPSKVSNLA